MRGPDAYSSDWDEGSEVGASLKVTLTHWFLTLVGNSFRLFCFRMNTYQLSQASLVSKLSHGTEWRQTLRKRGTQS